jgi:hypothetical protein
MKTFLNSRLSAFLLGALVVPTALAVAQPTTSAPEAPTPPKSRSNITIIKDGEVVFSKAIDKNTAWRSLDNAINGELADSIKQRVRAALKDAGGRVNISATGNTMTIIIDDENDKDGKNMVMSFSTDGLNEMGREFSRHFGHEFEHNFSNGGRNFNFNMNGLNNLRDMANKFRVMVAPHARSWKFNNNDDEDYTSKQAERFADEAKDLSREAEALRKEAEAMRLEAEAMKKRAEAMRLEGEARKKSSKSKDAKDAAEANETKKKK